MSSRPVQNSRAARERRVSATLNAAALDVGVVQNQAAQAHEASNNDVLLKKLGQMEQHIRMLEGPRQQKDAKEIAHARGQATPPADAKLGSGDADSSAAKEAKMQNGDTGKPAWMTAIPVTRDLTGKNGPVNTPNTLGQKGFGFIQPDDLSQDVFMHISAVGRAELQGLNERQRLSYEVVANRKTGKSSAENLRAL
jgi:CspA family cold shock protein